MVWKALKHQENIYWLIFGFRVGQNLQPITEQIYFGVCIALSTLTSYKWLKRRYTVIVPYSNFLLLQMLPNYNFTLLHQIRFYSKKIDFCHEILIIFKAAPKTWIIILNHKVFTVRHLRSMSGCCFI